MECDGTKTIHRRPQVNNVGAGLLANAVGQLMTPLTGTPPSRASPLPHRSRYGITGGRYFNVVPNAHSRNNTSGVCTSNCTKENPIKSRAFNPNTPSNGSI